MSSPNEPDENAPDWWKGLSDEDRAFVQRLFGSQWRPDGTEDEIWKQFEETRKRIREIEKRALSKLRGSGDDSSPEVT
jgi:DNA-directed RNA polymerase sigma subunit (sigma70/sigma32)